MGTAGSFDIATLTDLLVLSYVYERDYNIKNITPDLFEKVGDDLWCYDPHNYILNCYTKELGLEINLNKTKEATTNNLVGEYVSRNLNWGFDVSRISANICRAVKKNILELPELCRHLNERDVPFYCLPLRKILEASIKGEKSLYIRTFMILTLLKPDVTELDLLRKSLERDYGHFIASDPIISMLKNNIGDRESLHRRFLVESISETLCDLEDQMKKIFKSQIPGYECSLDLIEDSIKANSFKYADIASDHSLAYTTSKFVLAKCYRLLNDIQSLSKKGKDTKQEKSPMVVKSSKYELPVQVVIKITELESLFDSLSSILQAMTFQELGIISRDHTAKPYRPTTTKLFNFVSRLVFLPDLGIEPNPVSLGYVTTGTIGLYKKVSKDKTIKTSYLEAAFLPISSSSKGLITLDQTIDGFIPIDHL
jgi:hypothetical protein